jgi:hypothetical protein
MLDCVAWFVGDLFEQHRVTVLPVGKDVRFLVEPWG